MRSPPHDKRDIASRQIGLDIRQTLIEKDIVPKIGVRKIRISPQSKPPVAVPTDLQSSPPDRPRDCRHPVARAASSRRRIVRWDRELPLAAPSPASRWTILKLFGKVRLRPSHELSVRGAIRRSFDGSKNAARRPHPCQNRSDDFVTPQPPRPADVVGQRHRNQHQKRKEPGAYCQLNQLRLILDVHKKQNNNHRLWCRQSPGPPSD